MNGRRRLHTDFILVDHYQDVVKRKLDNLDTFIKTLETSALAGDEAFGIWEVDDTM